MSYQEDLQIDIHRLEEEWQKQPLLFQEYNELYAQACLDRDEKKRELEDYKAWLDRDVRNNQYQYHLDKITEAGIKAAIDLDEKKKSLEKDLNQAIYEANKLLGVKLAFEHRKSALEYECKLWLSGYFSRLKDPEETRQEYLEFGTESQKARLNRTMKERQRRLTEER